MIQSYFDISEQFRSILAIVSGSAFYFGGGFQTARPGGGRAPVGVAAITLRRLSSCLIGRLLARAAVASPGAAAASPGAGCRTGRGWPISRRSAHSRRHRRSGSQRPTRRRRAQRRPPDATTRNRPGQSVRPSVPGRSAAVVVMQAPLQHPRVSRPLNLPPRPTRGLSPAPDGLCSY